MLVKQMLGAAFFCAALVWLGMVISERNPCEQIKVAAAPVRLVFQGARALDRNLQVLADPITWLSWSIRADAYAQNAVARVLYGPDMQCDSF